MEKWSACIIFNGHATLKFRNKKYNTWSFCSLCGRIGNKGIKIFLGFTASNAVDGLRFYELREIYTNGRCDCWMELDGWSGTKIL